jgi:hypothetical protein
MINIPAGGVKYGLTGASRRLAAPSVGRSVVERQGDEESTTVTHKHAVEGRHLG